MVMLDLDKYNEDELLAIQTELFRDRISEFTKEVFKIVSPGSRYLHNWHIDCIAEHLHAIETGELHRLIVNIH